MGTTYDHVKYWTRLTASAAFSFLKINLVGGLSTGLCVTVLIFLIIHQSLGDGPGPGHVGGAGILVVLFSVRPVAFILAAIILFASPFLFFILGNKYIVMRISSKILKEKGEDLLFPLLETVLNKVKGGSPELLHKGSDMLKVKLRLIQEIKDSSHNKWAKRITTWGLERADLGSVDLGAENLSLTQILRDRIVMALRTFATPSRKFFWVILAVQWTAVVLTALKIV
jgi:hypothetical protein